MFIGRRATWAQTSANLMWFTSGKWGRKSWDVFVMILHAIYIQHIKACLLWLLRTSSIHFVPLYFLQKKAMKASSFFLFDPKTTWTLYIQIHTEQYVAFCKFQAKNTKTQSKPIRKSHFDGYLSVNLFLVLSYELLKSIK